MDDNMKRLASTTRNFWHLQGLHGVAIGMALIIASILELTGVVTGWHINTAFSLLISFTVIVVSPMVRRYYSKRFGTVIPPAKQDRRWRVISVLAGAVLGAVMILDGTGPLRGLPFVPFGVACGLLLLLWGFSPRRHYIVLGLLVIGFSLLPAFHLVVRQQVRHGGVLLLVGLVLMLGGVIDHGILLRSLPPLRPEEHLA